MGGGLPRWGGGRYYWSEIPLVIRLRVFKLYFIDCLYIQCRNNIYKDNVINA